MAADSAAALASLREFNYERIYVRPESLAQARAVVEVLQALVEHFVARPDALPETVVPADDPVRAAVVYVAGMTDRFAFDLAVRDLGWDPARLPLRLGG
jgi:dGTPase